MIPIKQKFNLSFKIVRYKNTYPYLLRKIMGFFSSSYFKLFTILFKNTHLTCKIILPNTLLRYADLPKNSLKVVNMIFLPSRIVRGETPCLNAKWLSLTCINNSYLAKTPHCIFDSQNLCTNFPKSPLHSAFMPA